MERVKKMVLGIRKSGIKKEERNGKTDSSSRKMTLNEIRQFAKVLNTDDLVRVENEYFQDLILYFLSSHPGIVLKGGTALHKIWNADRFSADLDIVGEVPSTILDDLLTKLKEWGYPTRIGDMREYGDGDVTVKLVIRGIVYLYHNITIDLFPTSPVVLSPQLKKLDSIFQDIPSFSIPVMSPTEILAEKTRTLFSRERSQDLHDINFLLEVTPIDWQLLDAKMKYDGMSYSLNEMKRRINKLEPSWEDELSALLSEVPNFDATAKDVLTAFGNRSMINNEKVEVLMVQ